MNKPVGPSVWLLTVGGCLAVLVLAGTVAMTAGVAATTGPVQAQATNETNVTHHENPDRVNEQGNSARVSEWLEDRLTQRLEESSVRISEGQYESAEGLIGESFEERLGQFVDVAGETRDEDDVEDTTESFSRARDAQRDIASQSREYEQTYQEYRTALERGNETAARQRARRLDRLAENITRSEQNATQSLQIIANRTDENVSVIRERIQQRVQNVTEQQQEVRTETFVETSLRVRTNATRTSFSNPAVIRGRLATANGTAIADRTVRIRIGERVYQRTTTANGTVRILYRPVSIPATAERVPVAYRPTATAPYLGTETNVSVDIEQVTPTVRTTVQPSRVRFAQSLSINTTVTVDGRPVPGVPIRVFLANRSQGQVRTASDGIARGEQPLPASVPTGTVTTRSQVAFEGRAIGPATGSSSLSVRDSPTSIEIDTRVSATQILLNGSLTATPDGSGSIAVPNQSVQVSVGDTSRTVETDSNGSYQVALAREEIDSDNGTVPVTVTFDGGGTNLETARATTRLSLGGDAGSGGLAVSLWILAALGVGVVLIGGYLWWRRQEVDEETADEDDTPSQPEDTPVGPTPPESDSPLAVARDALAGGATDDAVRSAYVAVRRRLSGQFGVDEAATPREFDRACSDHLSGDASAALTRLTEAYEQAAFAPTTDAAIGQRALTAATTLLEGETQSASDTADD